MKTTGGILVIFLTLALNSCNSFRYFDASHPNIRVEGRSDLSNPDEIVLIGSASFTEARFKGDSCILFLKKLNKKGEYNFVSIELDGKYLGRKKINVERILKVPVAVETKSKSHTIRVYKATEAQNGDVSFAGIQCRKLLKPDELPDRKIEFIGNSITCGMGIDWKEIPCHSGVWYDQHNASLAYGPLAAKALNARFQLSSVSGIGIYRNWNSLHPVMPEVFENLHLDTNISLKWEFNRYQPDLVSICLGTNDFSDGDGQSYRAPFDSAKYVAGYISFLKKVFNHYPEAQVCLLTSPMVTGQNARLFEICLTAVKDHFKMTEPGRKEIALFIFNGLTPHGCDSHPDGDDHQKMAELLIPFYKKLMGW